MRVVSENGSWQSGPSPYRANPASAVPGWYADPYIHHGLRYWDGRGWTGHIAAADTAAYQAPTYQLPTYQAPGYEAPAVRAPAYPLAGYPPLAATTAVALPSTEAALDEPSVAALVFGVLGLGVVAIPCGIVGIVRTKNGLRRGRKLAIGGLVAAGVWTVVLVVALIVGIVDDDASAASLRAGRVSPHVAVGVGWPSGEVVPHSQSRV